MAFAGLILGWAFGKAADKAHKEVKHLTGYGQLQGELDKAVREWGKGLPEDAYMNPEVFFARADTDDAQTRCPGREKLEDILAKSELPRVELWHAALLEKWWVVKERHKEGEAQPFFALEESQAGAHLRALAELLCRACANYPKIFRVHTTKKLDKIDQGIKKLSDEIDSRKVAQKGSGKQVIPKARLTSESHAVCRKHERKQIERNPYMLPKEATYFSLIPQSYGRNSLQAALIKMRNIEKERATLHLHPGEEFLFSLSGKIQLEVVGPDDPSDNRVYELNSEKVGKYHKVLDSFWLPSHIPHGCISSSDESELLAVFHNPKYNIPQNSGKLLGGGLISLYDAGRHDFNNIRSGFGCNLRLHTARQNLTPADLSSKLEVSEDEIKGWLDFTREPPDASMIDKITNTLGLKYSLLSGCEEKSLIGTNTSWAKWDYKRTDHNDPRQYCCLLNKQDSCEMQSILMKFKPKRQKEARLGRHSGEEFVYILSGKLNLIIIDEALTGLKSTELKHHFKFNSITYEKAIEILNKNVHEKRVPEVHWLEEGDSFYIRSDSYHAVYAPKIDDNPEDTVVLSVHFDEGRRPKGQKKACRSRKSKKKKVR